VTFGPKDRMGASEDFLLKWNDHHSLFFAGAEELCESEEYTDVTLAAGQKFFSAHKLVLSICSPYFRSLFKRLGSNVKSVIFLKDVDPKHLELLLEYMYKGEIKVQEQELVNVLNAAQSLEIKGLTDNGQNSSESNKSNTTKAEPKPHHSNNKRSSPAPEPVRKRPKPQPTVVEPSPSVITAIAPPPAVLNVKEEQEVIPVPDEEEEGAWSEDQQGTVTGYTEPSGGYHSNTVATGYEEMGYDEGGEEYYGEDGMVNIEGGEGDDRVGAWDYSLTQSDPSLPCDICGKRSATKKDLQKHMNTHTRVKPYACQFCHRGFGDPSNRKKHERNVHKDLIAAIEMNHSLIN